MSAVHARLEPQPGHGRPVRVRNGQATSWIITGSWNLAILAAIAAAASVESELLITNGFMAHKLALNVGVTVFVNSNNVAFFATRDYEEQPYQQPDGAGYEAKEQVKHMIDWFPPHQDSLKITLTFNSRPADYLSIYGPR
ncbi:MAG: hypothetical protein ORN21_07045 [Methylophilaceae bacterium]|nr:hypothetical protein [Methylophilaceae bacterium]